MAYIIDRARDAAFLKEEKQDPLTYQPFAPGDRVVVCAKCRRAHLESSWVEAGSQCFGCNGTETREVASLNELLEPMVLRSGGQVRPRRPARRSFRRLDAAEAASTSRAPQPEPRQPEPRRRSFRPLGVITLALTAFLLFMPVKNFVTEHFFSQVEAADTQLKAPLPEETYAPVKLELPEMSDWQVADPIGCMVVAPACNVRTSPDTDSDNKIAQLPWGTWVDWSDATVSASGTSWFYVTALDGTDVTGWVSGKTIDYVYDKTVEVRPHTATGPTSLRTGKTEHQVANVTDHYCLTSWYSEGTGEGAEITLEYDAAVVRNIVLTNGDASSSDAYWASSRVCDVEFEFDNGEIYHTTIADEYVYGGFSCLINTDTPSTAVTIRVLSMYEGSNPHLAISDISLYTAEINRQADVNGWRQ